MTDTAPGPLSGTLVVDLSRALAGPHATMMFGDLGARVIKVEARGAGDATRGWGPPFVQPRDAEDEADRESTYFLSANRNKESITLDLKAEDDRQVLLDLVRRADVLVENFRSGVLDRLGLGVGTLHELNPGLVILSITGFGHDGPEYGRAGYDQIAQGEAGLMSLTGSSPDDPQKVGTPIADLLAGMYGVLAALLERARTGVGRVAHVPAGLGRRGTWLPVDTADDRRRGWPRPRAITTPPSPRTGSSSVPTARCRAPSAAKDCGAGSAPASTSIPRPPVSRRTANALLAATG
jgi:crotonobetainyl-CoA:carnitine CoA-transferase CaiB-like acyl-CoA transferase